MCCSCVSAPTAAALLGGWAIGRYLGLDEVTSATYLVSSAMCIAAIACLSQQSSARTGNALGLVGVSGGIVATLGGMQADPGTYAQVRISAPFETSPLGRWGRGRGGVRWCADQRTFRWCADQRTFLSHMQMAWQQQLPT